MPELPEVETVCRGLQGALVGNTFVKVQQRRPDLRIPFPDRFVENLEGQAVQELKRRAKYIQIFLENGLVLIVHLGMSGRMVINSNEDLNPHDHVIFIMDSQHEIRYRDPRRFGLMTICKAQELAQHRLFRHLGPEPLEESFNAYQLLESLGKKKVPIKTALLDQRVVSGLGNIYVCEALFRAGISPLRAAYDCEFSELEELVPHIKQVLGEAIAAGGSTLRDHVQTTGEMGYFQHTFKVYGKAGSPCDGCGKPIVRTVQAGRSTFYCQQCQR